MEYPRSPAPEPEVKLDEIRQSPFIDIRYMESEPDGVDIEISSATLTEAILHVCLVRRAGSSIVEPVSINGANGKPRKFRRCCSLGSRRWFGLRSASHCLNCTSEKVDHGSQGNQRDVSSIQGGVLANDMPVDLKARAMRRCREV